MAIEGQGFRSGNLLAEFHFQQILGFLRKSTAKLTSTVRVIKNSAFTIANGKKIVILKSINFQMKNKMAVESQGFRSGNLLAESHFQQILGFLRRSTAKLTNTVRVIKNSSKIPNLVFDYFPKIPSEINLF